MKIAALAAALALAGCTAEPAPEAPPKTSPAPVTGAYPLTTCVVSGEPLGGMGEPVKYDHEGTEVRFCCGKCIGEFKKDPKKYIAILEAARKK